MVCKRDCLSMFAGISTAPSPSIYIGHIIHVYKSFTSLQLIEFIQLYTRGLLVYIYIQVYTFILRGFLIRVGNPKYPFYFRIFLCKPSANGGTPGIAAAEDSPLCLRRCVPGKRHFTIEWLLQ